MKTIAALLSVALVLLAQSCLVTAEPKNYEFANMPTLNQTPPKEKKTEAVVGKLVRAISDAKQARLIAGPQPLINIIANCGEVMSMLGVSQPNWNLYDQLDAFFYVAELLPQQYNLNYVKRH
ncbi:uncharacterized protein LOC129756160 [Uranotaenia lowii]|uniref:uncharacterized protein LOC129756160 n=1 Tax=Uranotaenia lowii TaxID=190385 RepID=UPI00247ADBC6|nr:uncharacterized protein LOC129756160 [Uranotaenia lowii]